MNTQAVELARAGDVTPASVRRTLFENENVVTKIGDHGLSHFR